MNLRGSLSLCNPLRALIIPLFRRLNAGDISITHHWTGDRLRLHSFKHKGYWFHGKSRAQRSMRSVGTILNPGDTVFDVGGHIGYMSLYLAHLVGRKGRVFTFGPGPNNLPYPRKNISTCRHENITLCETAVGRSNGSISLSTEDLTGQNNSTIANYGVLAENTSRHNTTPDVAEVKVPCETVDNFVARKSVHPDFLKVDVEGAKLDVLEGMRATLSETRPLLMIEITYRHQEAVRHLRRSGYDLLDRDLRPVENPAAIAGNTFALPEERLGDVKAPVAHTHA